MQTSVSSQKVGFVCCPLHKLMGSTVDNGIIACKPKGVPSRNKLVCPAAKAMVAFK